MCENEGNVNRNQFFFLQIFVIEILNNIHWKYAHLFGKMFFQCIWHKNNVWILQKFTLVFQFCGFSVEVILNFVWGVYFAGNFHNFLSFLFCFLMLNFSLLSLSLSPSLYYFCFFLSLLRSLSIFLWYSKSVTTLRVKKTSNDLTFV